MGCRRYSAANQLGMLLDEDELSIFLTSSWTLKIFCFFHNCMWQSWHSEVNVFFLELGERLSTHGSPRSCLISVHVFVLSSYLSTSSTDTGTQLWMDFGPSTSLPVLDEFLVPSRPNKTSFSISWVNVCSPTGIGFLVLVGFVGYPCCFQLLLNPILSSNYFWRKFLEEAEVTYILSRIIISPDSITTTFGIQWAGSVS